LEDLLAQVSAHATRTGRPHWLVLDEAHHLLPASMQTKAVGPLDQFGSLMLITVHPEAVDEAVLRTVNTVLAVGAGAADALAAVAGAGGKAAPEPQEPDLPSGRVALWRAHLGRVDAVDLTPPRGERQRHRRKYALGTMAPEESFYFRGPEERLNLRAHNLVLFLQIGNGVDDETGNTTAARATTHAGWPTSSATRSSPPMSPTWNATTTSRSATPASDCATSCYRNTPWPTSQTPMTGPRDDTCHDQPDARRGCPGTARPHAWARSACTSPARSGGYQRSSPAADRVCACGQATW
jgi:hypothetical protein